MIIESTVRARQMRKRAKENAKIIGSPESFGRSRRVASSTRSLGWFEGRDFSHSIEPWMVCNDRNKMAPDIGMTRELNWSLLNE